MGHSTEGLTIPADMPQRAMTRVCFREVPESSSVAVADGELRWKMGKGAWQSRRAKVRCHVCMRAKERFYKGLWSTVFCEILTS